MQITIPSSSREFALNIGPEENITHPPAPAERPDHAAAHSWPEALLHFNPRYNTKKKEIIFVDMNDWTWGIIDRRPFSSFNVLPVGTFTLMIQVNCACMSFRRIPCLVIMGVFACICI
jgi:hypothetical protein